MSSDSFFNTLLASMSHVLLSQMWAPKVGFKVQTELGFFLNILKLSNTVNVIKI